MNTPRRRSSPKKPPSIIPADLEAALERAFGLVAYVTNRHLVDHFVRAAHELDCDLESLVIWGLLASRNVAHLMPPGIVPAEILDERGHARETPLRLRPLRIRQIAQATRIPRETVRRKLEKLRRAGRVVRGPAGWTFNSEGVDEQLREFTKETIRRHLAATQVVVNALAAAAHQNTGG